MRTAKVIIKVLDALINENENKIKTTADMKTRMIYEGRRIALKDTKEVIKQVGYYGGIETLIDLAKKSVDTNLFDNVAEESGTL